MYFNGQGVEQDYRLAGRWFQKAAMQGSVEGQFNLAEMYYHGRGMKQDYSKAYAWLTVSEVGRFNFQVASRLKQISDDMSPQELAEAVHLSKELRNNIARS
jgi:hypothetical protein